jgi:hypothetical protein
LSIFQILNTLGSMVSQIHDTEIEIKGRIKEIESFKLFQVTPANEISASRPVPSAGGVKLVKSTLKSDSVTPDTENQRHKKHPKRITIKEYDDGVKPIVKYSHLLNQSRAKSVQQMTALYNSIGPNLRKLEGAIVGSCSGETEKMVFYYSFWEKEIFTSLMRFTLKSLADHLKALNANKPIFSVNATLLHDELTLHPEHLEVYNLMIKSVREFLEQLKVFRRWMAETCLLTPCNDKDVNSKNCGFTFFEDIVQVKSLEVKRLSINFLNNLPLSIQSPKVCELVVSLKENIVDLVSDVRSYLSR